MFFYFFFYFCFVRKLLYIYWFGALSSIQILRILMSVHSRNVIASASRHQDYKFTGRWHLAHRRKSTGCSRTCRWNLLFCSFDRCFYSLDVCFFFLLCLLPHYVEISLPKRWFSVFIFNLPLLLLPNGCVVVTYRMKISSQCQYNENIRAICFLLPFFQQTWILSRKQKLNSIDLLRIGNWIWREAWKGRWIENFVRSMLCARHTLDHACICKWTCVYEYFPHSHIFTCPKWKISPGQRPAAYTLCITYILHT